MEYENDFYRTSGHRMTVEFLMVNVSEETGWRAYILSEINYKAYSDNRSDGGHQTHRISESDREMIRKVKTFMLMNPPFPGTPARVDPERELCYICWTGHIKTKDSIRLLAATWAEISAYYIQFGGSFETIQPVLKRLGMIRL